MSNNTTSLLDMTPPNKTKAENIFQELAQLSPDELAVRSQEAGQWHNSLLILTKKLVEASFTDEQIHAQTDRLTTYGFTVSETRVEVQKMINGARQLPSAKVAQTEQQIEMLAKLGDTQYALERKELDKDIGVTAGDLDRLRKQKQQEFREAEDDELVEPVAPLDGVVDAVDLAEGMEVTPRKHLAFRHQEYATALTLWSLSTWFIDSWKIMPHLFFRSLTKGSGKTTALQVVEAFSCRSFVCANITPAALFRLIEQCSPTLLLDEVDRYLSDKEDLNGIINAGHTRRTATVTRVEPSKDAYVLRSFKVFGGKCFAGIGRQMDTMMDRSIVVIMEKRMDNERVEKLPLTFFEDMYPTRRMIAKFAADNELNAVEALPHIPNLGNDRAVDNWQPLFTVAQVIGGDWPDKCLAAYECIETISTEDAKEQDNVAIRILRELAPKIEKRTGYFLPAKELREMLISDEESEFFEWYNGNTISAKAIKKHLTKDAGVKHERRSGGSVYSLTDIRELVARYVRE